MQLVNWELLRNPYNYFVVALMLAIGVFGLCLLFGENGGQVTADTTGVDQGGVQ